MTTFYTLLRLVLTVVLVYMATFTGGWWLFATLLLIALANELAAVLVARK